MTLGINMLNNIFLLYPKVYTHDTTISVFNNFFPLHTEMQFSYHLKYRIGD